MNRITFFTRPGCKLCDGALFVLNKVAQDFKLDLDRVDISAADNAEWAARYAEHIPVVNLNGREIFRHRVDEPALRRLLAAENAAPAAPR